MLFSEQINIALCFNSETEAITLSEQLKEIAPNIHFIIAPTFSDFLLKITNADKIDCFIVEERYKDCAAIDLVDQIKRNPKYKKSVISIFSTNLKKVDNKFYELNSDYIFDLSFELNNVILNLRKLIVKNLMPVIPKDFNVLVLDNSPEILEVISLHLQELGHEKIELCTDILAAKKFLLSKDYDLLLLDWNLDDGTCFDVIDFIKNNPVSSRTKAAVTVVITGRDDVEDIMTLLKYGINDHIIKPFGFQEFEDKIGYAVEKNVKRI
ncbi:response regulator [Bacteriovorax sp. PP10]|uniref:Response regulator n=1 Tax=Bacteriovorax antarcticus TaxID=3088717 RepID=A0ABU5VYY3_9BACT|nr:response regulator [Bacteriovorax sp. PP10]MEA9358266.1 response regulator [Bacteriovorax sp. PP10]